jgi:hypothetical protein
MRHTVDPKLTNEARVFALRFACDDCAHYDRTRGLCVHGYTERPMRDALEHAGDVVAFCKEFELT